MLKVDTCTFRKWCGLETFQSRACRTRLECHGDGCGVLDANLEDSRLRASTERSEIRTNGHFSHEVREGDTLTLIANKYNVTVQSIASSNKIADIDYIHAGKSLLIPVDHFKPGEVHAEADGPSHLVETQGSESKSGVVHTESSLLTVPNFVSSSTFQSWHVKLGLFLVLLFALSSFLKRCLSDLRTRKHEEGLRYQIEKEAQGLHYQPKLRRWQGILDDDRKIDEVDGDKLADGRLMLEVEEEKLRQSYALLESKYVEFLADSGLSKSGYWRGGMPPALEET